MRNVLPCLRGMLGFSTKWAGRSRKRSQIEQFQRKQLYNTVASVEKKPYMVENNSAPTRLSRLEDCVAPTQNRANNLDILKSDHWKCLKAKMRYSQKMIIFLKSRVTSKSNENYKSCNGKIQCFLEWIIGICSFLHSDSM